MISKKEDVISKFEFVERSDKRICRCCEWFLTGKCKILGDFVNVTYESWCLAWNYKRIENQWILNSKKDGDWVIVEITESSCDETKELGGTRFKTPIAPAQGEFIAYLKLLMRKNGAPDFFVVHCDDCFDHKPYIETIESFGIQFRGLEIKISGGN